MKDINLSEEERAILLVDLKCRVIKAANRIKSVKQVCDLFNVPRSTFYEWRKKYDKDGFEGLRRQIPVENNHPQRLADYVVDKILELRKEYQLGAIRITWYLERYHGIKTSESSVYRTLDVTD